jgi:hypothetical protein
VVTDSEGLIENVVRLYAGDIEIDVIVAIAYVARCNEKVTSFMPRINSDNMRRIRNLGGYDALKTPALEVTIDRRVDYQSFRPSTSSSVVQ